MSFTPASSRIESWIDKGLEWSYFWRPVMRPFTIPARGQVQVPGEGYTFKAPEGTLISFAGIFDHPNCGIRLECHPELDTGEIFTVNNLALGGSVNQPWDVSAVFPPQTPPGIYSIASLKEWPFEEWMRLYVLNSDNIDHRCIAYFYTVAFLKESRKEGKVKES